MPSSLLRPMEFFPPDVIVHYALNGTPGVKVFEVFQQWIGRGLRDSCKSRSLFHHCSSERSSLLNEGLS